jgi:hypothetical protein
LNVKRILSPELGLNSHCPRYSAPYPGLVTVCLRARQWWGLELKQGGSAGRCAPRRLAKRPTTHRWGAARASSRSLRTVAERRAQSPRLEGRVQAHGKSSLTVAAADGRIAETCQRRSLQAKDRMACCREGPSCSAADSRAQAPWRCLWPPISNDRIARDGFVVDLGTLPSHRERSACRYGHSNHGAAGSSQFSCPSPWPGRKTLRNRRRCSTSWN